MVNSELSITIDAPPEKVFARISDPMKAMEDVPNIIEVKDITGQGVGMSYKLVYKMAGIRLSLDCTFVEYAPNERVTIQIKGAMNATQTFEVNSLNAGSQLLVTAEYEIPIPLVGKIAEVLLKKRNEREWEASLQNIKASIEAETPAAVD
jgi:carbon monoxide dehydrogenase subunit G